MNVKSVCEIIEEIAPLSLQESYDNAGLLVGNPLAEVTAVLVCIDVTEDVIREAISKKCNMIISHHPLIFTGLKKIVGQNEIQRCVIQAIKNDISIYAAHTNLDQVSAGVSAKMAEVLGLVHCSILQPKRHSLLKLVTYVPKLHSYRVRQALFDAGAGTIGNYDSCSFNSEGYGTFRANEFAQPFVGEFNQLHTETEIKIELILPSFLKTKIIRTLIEAHPYEEPAYDIISLENECYKYGFGIVGELEHEVSELDFLKKLKECFDLDVLKHTNLRNKQIKRVALCGGAGSSLVNDAIASEADIFISGDFKYHDFFEVQNHILIADIGHFESEQFTKDVFYEIITKKMPTFAVQISESKTNPINYL